MVLSPAAHPKGPGSQASASRPTASPKGRRNAAAQPRGPQLPGPKAPEFYVTRDSARATRSESRPESRPRGAWHPALWWDFGGRGAGGVAGVFSVARMCWARTHCSASEDALGTLAGQGC